jgi:hypothetical protein
LRAWRPRRLSAGLERRIFNASPARPKVLVWSLRLAPAAACVLIALSALHQSGGISNGSYSHELSAAMGSNQMAALSGDYHQEHNDISALTFEWTKRVGSTSSISSFAPGKTN